MIEINLLPVREAKRKESLRFQISIAALILLFVIIFIAYLHVGAKNREAKINKQLIVMQEELKQLNTMVGEIDKLKQQKEKLAQKLSVIKDLDKGRLGAAIILGELCQLTPEKAWLESLEKSDKSLKLTGVALDNDTIANFMTQLERSKYFGNIELEASEQVTRGGMKLMKFSLRCTTAL